MSRLLTRTKIQNLDRSLVALFLAKKIKVNSKRAIWCWSFYFCCVKCCHISSGKGYEGWVWIFEKGRCGLGLYIADFLGC